MVLSIGLITQPLIASSELYLKINMPGTHTVTIGDQIQTSSTNEFRFHGLNSGIWTITISNNQDKSLSNYSVTLSNDYRTVVELNDKSSLVLLGNILVEQKYWYMDFFSPVFNSATNTTHVGLDEYTFGFVKEYVKKQEYESRRLAAAKEATKNNSMSSIQITTICKLFDYDSNRLEYAKFAYDFVADKGMYFLVNGSFEYSSSVDELRSYVANH